MNDQSLTTALIEHKQELAAEAVIDEPVKHIYHPNPPRAEGTLMPAFMILIGQRNVGSIDSLQSVVRAPRANAEVRIHLEQTCAFGATRHCCSPGGANRW